MQGGARFQGDNQRVLTLVFVAVDLQTLPGVSGFQDVENKFRRRALETHVVDHGRYQSAGNAQIIDRPSRRVYKPSVITSRWNFLRVPPANELPIRGETLIEKLG